MGTGSSTLSFFTLDLSALNALQSFDFSSLSDANGTPEPIQTPAPTPRPTLRPTQMPTNRPTLSVAEDGIVNVQRSCMTSPSEVDASRFNICLDLEVTKSTIPYFIQAAEKWESVNVGDQPSNGDFYGPFSSSFSRDDNIFIDFKPEYIDDLYISAKEKRMDGPGGKLGLAGPRFVNNVGVPVVGIMEFDEDDIQRIKSSNTQLLLNAITHEIAHVQGFGTLWQSNGLFDPVTGIYSGTEANKLWTNACGGTSIPVQIVKRNGQPVEDPLDESQYDGSVYTHWDENCFGDELMTPLLSPNRENYLSQVTVAGLADLGWTVDYSNVQPFVPPSADSGCRLTCTPTGGRQLRGEVQRDLDLIDEVSGQLERAGDFLGDLSAKNAEYRQAAKFAFESLSEARLNPPQDIPEGLRFVGGEVTTVLMIDENFNIKDLTFTWRDVKDMIFD